MFRRLAHKDVVQSTSRARVIQLFLVLQESWDDEQAELKRDEQQKEGD